MVMASDRTLVCKALPDILTYIYVCAFACECVAKHYITFLSIYKCVYACVCIAKHYITFWSICLCVYAYVCVCISYSTI